MLKEPRNVPSYTVEGGGNIACRNCLTCVWTVLDAKPILFTNCRAYRHVKTKAGDTLAERYEQTMTRLEKITQAGYQVEIMWECRFDKDILPQHPELQKISVFDQGPLHTRDAPYGGRTEAMRLHYKVREGEVIRYVVMSLYPYICKYGKFPKNHPIIHTGDSCKDVEAMLKKEGLIKCSILPPRQLYHPVLLYRCNQKLLFWLCRTAPPK
jgi:hypothetical protein